MFARRKNALYIAMLIIAVAGIYLYTAYPAFKNNDSPETITCAYTLGIGHPPSYPLYTMAGKIATLLLPGSPAFSMNLFSILLGLMVLLVSYFVLRENNRVVFGESGGWAVYFGTMLLAFSYIFWNQAIEAKGGIYVLNLLFLSLIILFTLKLSQKYDAKYFYLMSYVSGLSLANHWPSMIILGPALIFIYFKYGGRFGLKGTVLNCLFLVLGTSAYIYLPIRGHVEGVFVFMARPDNWRDLVWTVSRQCYLNDNLHGPNSFGAQAAEYAGLFSNDYLFFGALAIPGAVALWKLKKSLLYFYSAIFLIIIISVTVFYRAPANALPLIDVFSMPAQYVVLILVMTGYYYFYRTMENRILRNVFALVSVLLLLFTAAVHFKQNNSRQNYTSYDFGNNLIKTLDPGSFYIAEFDPYHMPLIYFQNVLHEGCGIRNFNIGSIRYAWGIDDFIKQYGRADLRENDIMGNVTRIIGVLAGKTPVYFSSYAKLPQEKLNEYRDRVCGVVFKVSKNGSTVPPGVFDIYCYRGIYGTNSGYDAELFSLYGERMAMLADELFMTGDYYGSIRTYNKALLLYEKTEGRRFVSRSDIYYNLSVDYSYISDKEGQLRCLLKTVENQPDFWQAYEDAGMLYYQGRDPDSAREMFRKAIYYGSPNEEKIKMMGLLHEGKPSP